MITFSYEQLKRIHEQYAMLLKFNTNPKPAVHAGWEAINSLTDLLLLKDVDSNGKFVVCLGEGHIFIGMVKEPKDMMIDGIKITQCIRTNTDYVSLLEPVINR